MQPLRLRPLRQPPAQVHRGCQASRGAGRPGSLRPRLASLLVDARAPAWLPRRLQAWLQEFAWTEAELPKRLRERESTLAHAESSVHGGGHAQKAHLLGKLAREPMFCFEVGQGSWASHPC